ncbi:MAG: hypothetical protein B7X53_05085 [Hyphomonas sp. 34-62-18]|nr:MAG: hypothetical protein B7X53_05085 [Hyphomonas sp. 34-62-18]
MTDTLRRAVIALTLLVLGGGHAACACASVAQALTGPEVAVAEMTGHAGHTVTVDLPDADHCDRESENQGHDCTGCEAVALPADSLSKAVSPFPADVAILPLKPANDSGRVFQLADLRIEPARGPPRPSPSLVTLKIRLQN